MPSRFLLFVLAVLALPAGVVIIFRTAPADSPTAETPRSSRVMVRGRTVD
jgi:hypothetical protein